MHAPAAVEVALAQARQALGSARRLLVLCGAGLSAASGVPTFRGPDGLWRQWRPEELATQAAFDHAPEEVWAWYRWRLEVVLAARPNLGHRALVRLAERRESVVLSQNVDGLLEEVWEEAGLDPARLAALHGSLRRAHCERCAVARPMSELPTDALPRCACGGRLRPSVVWFGESLQPRHLHLLAEEPACCDLGLAVGTSALVWPAAGALEILRRRSRPVIVLNPDPAAALPGDLHVALGAEDGLVRLLEGMEVRA